MWDSRLSKDSCRGEEGHSWGGGNRKGAWGTTQRGPILGPISLRGEQGSEVKDWQTESPGEEVQSLVTWSSWCPSPPELFTHHTGRGAMNSCACCSLNKSAGQKPEQGLVSSVPLATHCVFPEEGVPFKEPLRKGGNNPKVCQQMNR